METIDYIMIPAALLFVGFVTVLAVRDYYSAEGKAHRTQIKEREKKRRIAELEFRSRPEQIRKSKRRDALYLGLAVVGVVLAIIFRENHSVRRIVYAGVGAGIIGGTWHLLFINLPNWLRRKK